MMKRKILIILSLVLILSFVFSACSTTPEATEEPEVEEPAEEEPVEEEEPEEEAEEPAAGSLIVYTNSGSGGRDAWLIEQAAEAGFDIEVLEGGGGDISNRIIAEKENPVADVVFGLNTMTYASMKAMDIFEQYEPVWAGEVTPGLNDPEHYYHGIVMQAIFCIYNSDLYDETTAPSDWPDLWNNEEYHGLYWLPASLGGGTTRTVISGILVRHRDENGEYGISEEGWSEIEKYFQYGTYEVEGEDFYSWLASGKTPFGQMWSSGIAQREEQYGVEAGLVGPEVGVPYVVEQVAILKGTDNLELAKQFVDWFGSADFQRKWAEEWDTMPANTLAAEGASESMQNIFSNYPPQDIDWSFVAENIESWVEKIELQYFMAQ
jgi:iron(III) transport system substrate-binding protein